MFDVILNEKKYAEDIISSGALPGHPFRTIMMLARYCRQISGMKPKETKAYINDFMTENYETFDPVIWSDAVDKAIRGAKKYPLSEIDCVSITQPELDYIRDIGDLNKERVMFSLLCLAKFYNIKNPNNNNWVNAQSKYVFVMADLSHMSVDNKDYLIYDLWKSGLITYSNKIDNLNIRVEFIDTDTAPAMVVTDFVDLGYQYTMWRNRGGYLECESCGHLYKEGAKTSKHLCRDCVELYGTDAKIIECADCGKKIAVSERAPSSRRCETCQNEAHRQSNIAKCRNYKAKLATQTPS